MNEIVRLRQLGSHRSTVRSEDVPGVVNTQAVSDQHVPLRVRPPSSRRESPANLVFFTDLLRVKSPLQLHRAQNTTTADEQTARTHLTRVPQRWNKVFQHAVVNRVQILDVEGRVRNGGVEDPGRKQVVPGDPRSASRAMRCE